MIDSNWARWIAASVAVYFKQVADDLSLPLIVEGIDEREPEKMEADHAELRVNGPFVYEKSKGYFWLDVDTNILLTDLMEGAQENTYDLMKWAGAFQQAAWKPILVYRYGPDISDDGSYVGCLVPRERKSATSLFHFGQVSVDDRVRQAMVDTRHRLELYVPAE